MKISIITVSYNSAATIQETIESVINQTYRNIEYIIVDGHSTDNTLDIIKTFGDKISQMISEPDEGIYDAMNKGISRASGDIIGILNSDDVYHNNRVVEKVMSRFSKSKSDIVYGDLVYVHREDLDRIVRYWKSGKYKEGRFANGWMPPHPAFFLRKQCYENYGTYNLEFKTSADYELMLRMMVKHELSFTYLPSIITRMRMGGQSNESVRMRRRANREDKRAWKVNNLNPKWYTFTIKPLSKISQFLAKPSKEDWT